MLPKFTDPSRRRGIEQALDGGSKDLMTIVLQHLSTIAEGAELTSAQLMEPLPRFVDDKPCRRGAVMRELNRKGYIEFHSYGPRAVPGDWDTPARVWRRTSKPCSGGDHE